MAVYISFQWYGSVNLNISTLCPYCIPRTGCLLSADSGSESSLKFTRYYILTNRTIFVPHCSSHKYIRYSFNGCRDSWCTPHTNSSRVVPALHSFPTSSSSRPEVLRPSRPTRHHEHDQNFNEIGPAVFYLLLLLNLPHTAVLLPRACCW